MSWENHTISLCDMRKNSVIAESLLDGTLPKLFQRLLPCQETCVSSYCSASAEERWVGLGWFKHRCREGDQLQRYFKGLGNCLDFVCLFGVGGKNPGLSRKTPRLLCSTPGQRGTIHCTLA